MEPSCRQRCSPRSSLDWASRSHTSSIRSRARAARTAVAGGRRASFFARRRGLRGRAAEALGIWRALAAADARVYIFRTGLSGGITAFTIGAAFCLLRRRQLVLSASNDLDFVFDRDDRPRRTEVVYRLVLRSTRRVVVQTESQVELARRAPGDGDRITLIPSFAELPESAPSSPEPDAFLWASRVVDYKLPLRYVELARALPEAKFRMVVAQTGETPAELMATVKGAAAELPIWTFSRPCRGAGCSSSSIARGPWF